MLIPPSLERLVVNSQVIMNDLAQARKVLYYEEDAAQNLRILLDTIFKTLMNYAIIIYMAFSNAALRSKKV